MIKKSKQVLRLYSLCMNCLALGLNLRTAGVQVLSFITSSGNFSKNSEALTTFSTLLTDDHVADRVFEVYIVGAF